MNLKEYETIVKDTDWLDIDWLRNECIERMRINVGLIAENTDLKRKSEQARQQIQVELLRVQAEVSDKAKSSEDMQRLTQANGYAKAMNDAVKIVGRVLDK